MKGLLRILFSLLAMLAACTGGPEPDVVKRAPGRGYFERLACGLPREQLQRIWDGYYPGRSGEVQIVPIEPNTVGNWFSHAGPWDYLQDVPMFAYGPGLLSATGRVQRPVTMSDVAPTVAQLVGFDFEALDGAAMREVVAAAGDRRPRLVVVLVWDSVGDNVLDTHPESWPTLRKLIPKGLWYENATVGSSPTVTGSVHATLGTGAYARRHGSVDHWLRLRGRMVESAKVGTGAVLVPAMTDLYDRARGNRPLIGVVASNTWHLAMAGHGSLFEGGDRDVGVTLRLDSAGWGLTSVNQPYFEFPEYANSVPRPDRREIDRSDGKIDGLLTGDEEVIDSVMWTQWQARLLDELIRREGFGADEEPDVLFTNFKRTDDAGHKWTMNSPQMERILRESDRALKQLIGMLDRQVGKGHWLLLLTADHGATPKINVSKGFQIEESTLREDLDATFDRDRDDRNSIMLQRPSQVWVDEQELEENGFTLEQVARYLAEYTKGQNKPDPLKLPASERDDRVFAAAFPSSIMESLPCFSPGEES